MHTKDRLIPLLEAEDCLLTYGVAKLVTFYEYVGIYRSAVETSANITVQEHVTENKKKSTVIDIEVVQLKISLKNNGASRNIIFHGRLID